ncbi:YybH family protein [Rhodohalobacter sulfatireducens]|uniref:SgcJ/EcaC family oxidoreductase n=1 Tax=Rhodohalobacter sulfatireducens TaxID=2911366 RepID=A0ABS9KFP7_9BACT|nr:SgcJ/EcaC family oxidoreductase [Rhodohalobacter sulfatireducens]MCG2589612.1 SgcJ/EcaC family oxidoreductase [Rhodohalobacter sulfatireducens]
MKLFHIFLLSLIFTLFLTCTNEAPPAEQSNEKDKEVITAVSDARAEAFNNSDAAGIAEHFTVDAILMAPGVPAMEGREAVRDYYQSIFDEYETDLDSYYEEIKIDGDLAYGRGVANVTLIPKNGTESSSSTSKYLNILQRQPDGTWKTTHDIWNSTDTSD